jgi:hypothetical protein
LARCCDEVTAGVAPAVAARVAAIRAGLAEPVRVAVAGRLKAGKSTLVNALIGRAVAPTAVGECTRVVTRFRYGTSDRIEVMCRDGVRVTVPWEDDGTVPRDLPVPAARVAVVDVRLTSDRLRGLTVLDTPGLSSTSPTVGAARRFVLDGSGGPVDDDSAAAIAGADAVLYVFTQAVRADDLAVLAEAADPLHALGVFTRVDELVDAGADPWPVAGPLAAEQAQLLSRVVGDVVPVVGLLAETVRAGRLGAADGAALRTLAGLPAAQRAVLLASVDLFTGRDAPVPAARRARLLRLLGRYGVGFAVAALAADVRLGSDGLVRLLEAASGLARLEHTLEVAVRRRSDAIRAARALTGLRALAESTPAGADREVLADAVEQVLADPAYHRLRLLDAARQVGAGLVRLPEPMGRELTRLAVGEDPAWILGCPPAGAGTLAEAAVAAARRWRGFAVAGAGPAQARVAHVGHRGFHLLAQRLRAS